MRIISFIIRILILLGLCIQVSCYIKPRYGTSADNMEAIVDRSIKTNQRLAQKPYIPNTVTSALLPSMRGHRRFFHRPDRRFDISVKDVPAKTFFTSLIHDTNQSIIVSPKITGNITLNLKNVTVPEALKAVKDTYGYQYIKTPFGYEVTPNELKTQIFTVNYLDIKRKGESTTSISSGQISDKITGSTGFGGSSSSTTSGSRTGSQQGQDQKVSGGSIKTESEINFWKSLKETLTILVGKGTGRSIVVNPTAGVIVVRAFPDELLQIARYLDNIQNNIKRQVILEAKILEVDLNDEYRAGINWQLFNVRNDEGNVMLNAINTFEEVGIKTLIPNAFSGVIKAGRDFEMFIRMLQTQGNVQILSSPRVATLNNQKAIIKVGQDEFFVTGVSSSTTTTGTSETPTQDIQLTPFFSGISLDVTPQIGRNGDVTLHIHPQVSEVQDQNKEITLGTQGDFNLPLALSTVRESDTIVHARNGEIIVIGGLMKNVMRESIAQAPFIGRIPYLGSLFRNTEQHIVKQELVILLQPIVVNSGRSWVGQLKKSKHYLAQYNRGFHIGGFPDQMGTEGERLIPPRDRSTRYDKGDQYK